MSQVLQQSQNRILLIVNIVMHFACPMSVQTWNLYSGSVCGVLWAQIQLYGSAQTLLFALRWGQETGF